MKRSCANSATLRFWNTLGRDAFKVRIFPITANSRKKIKITYTQLLKSDAGLIEYTYPMNTEKFSSRPLDNVSIKVTLNSKDPLKSIYSPTNNVEIRRDGDKRAVIGWEARNFRPDTDFKVIFSRSKQAVGVDLLTYRPERRRRLFPAACLAGIGCAQEPRAEKGRLLRPRYQRLDGGPENGASQESPQLLPEQSGRHRSL